MYRDRDQPTTSAEEIRAALLRWGRTVFGAPARLDALVTAIDECDEELVRVATSVVRRELVAERCPASPHQRGAGAATDARAIDPFAVTLAELRARTECEAPCSGCQGSAQVTCGGCAGSGRARCPGCAGTGHIVRYYKKSSRVIQCPDCRTKGTVRCAPCGSSGRVVCGTCHGSGRELRWWGYRESARTEVRLSSDSPVLAAHGALREPRPLQSQDLAAFTTRVVKEAFGPLRGEHLAPEDEAVCQQLTPALDPQTERIKHEQLARFTVLRRDVAYEMCGARGRVVLSGAQLAGGSTAEALGPIRARLRWWAAAACVVAFLGVQYCAWWAGPTAYFDDTNAVLAVAVALGALAALVGVGGVLRALRPGFRWWALRRVDAVAAGVLAVALFVCPLIRELGRPTIAEARVALSSDDPARARRVAEALEATEPSRAVSTLVEDIDLREARSLSGDARLSRLDDAAARDGARAAEARGLARRHRLDEVNALLAGHQPDAALDRLDRWSAALPNDPEAAELRARAHDERVSRCADDPCRVVAGRASVGAHATPARQTALATVRQRLLRALTARTPATGDAAVDVPAWRALSTLAASANGIQGDTELTSTARAADAWAAEQRGQVTLLGAPITAVEDILGRTPGGALAPAWPDLSGVAVYLARSGGRCTGLYAVGATEGARALTGREAGLQRLMAQAIAQPGATIHAAPATGRSRGVARWSEGRTRVTGRWRDGTLVELVIGEASP